VRLVEVFQVDLDGTSVDLLVGRDEDEAVLALDQDELHLGQPLVDQVNDLRQGVGSTLGDKNIAGPCRFGSNDDGLAGLLLEPAEDHVPLLARNGELELLLFGFLVVLAQGGTLARLIRPGDADRPGRANAGGADPQEDQHRHRDAAWSGWE